MATLPDPIVINIVGLEADDRGRSCEEHEVCGVVMQEDVVVRLRKVQVLVDGKEETAIAAYWITDGTERCRVGFLQRHMVKYATRYDGALAQVTRVLGDDAGCYEKEERKLFHKNKGFCYATLITALPGTVKGEVKVEKTEEIGGDSKSGNKREYGIITLE
jgi:hypothetical protein